MKRIYSDINIDCYHLDILVKKEELMKELEEYYTKIIRLSGNRNEILTIFTYYSESPLDISYDKYTKDFTEYLDSVMNNYSLQKNNTFGKINDKNWVNNDIAKTLEDYMNTLQRNNPFKKINYVTLPYYIDPKYEYVMNIDKEYTCVYWNVGGDFESNDNMRNFRYAEDLNKLLIHDFSILRNQILIIFVTAEYHPYVWDSNIENYEDFRQQFTEYLELIVEDKSLRRVNFFDKVNKAWYNINSWKYRRVLIDEYMNKLQYLNTDKTFKYLVLPNENDRYPYVIL
jgi:hypothetical protein